MKALVEVYESKFSEIMEMDIPFDKKMRALNILKIDAKMRLSVSDYISYLNTALNSLS